MRILITNDDGIDAPGLSILQKIARQLSDDIWTVAPRQNQSGKSHAISIDHVLELRQLDEKSFWLDGTPTDCVIMGVRKLLKEAPDLILSGVNAGQNISDDVTYSGTIAAAMEGTLLGVPSIALSQTHDWASDASPDINWRVSEEFGAETIQKILDLKIPQQTLVNVNFPLCPVNDVEGIRATRQGQLTHGLFIEEHGDDKLETHFKLKYTRQTHEVLPETDFHALQENCISVTPIGLDLTAYEHLDRYKDI